MRQDQVQSCPNHRGRRPERTGPTRRHAQLIWRRVERRLAVIWTVMEGPCRLPWQELFSCNPSCCFGVVYTVRSAYNWEPGAPCVKVFFISNDINCWREIRGLFWLKEPWSRRFGNLPTVAVRYRTLIRYRREGRRADPDFGPDPRLNLQTGYHIFLKLNKKYERIHSKVGADPLFLLKIMFKFFLKLLCVTRIRIRILESGSVKIYIKQETQKDSGSGRGPDQRIIPN
jgi:hypothetical protein